MMPPATSGHGTTVYLAGHSYSTTSSFSRFEVAGSRLVLNTLFNLGAACVETGVSCNTGQLGECSQGVMSCDSSGTPVLQGHQGPAARGVRRQGQRLQRPGRRRARRGLLRRPRQHARPHDRPPARHLPGRRQLLRGALPRHLGHVRVHGRGAPGRAGELQRPGQRLRRTGRQRAGHDAPRSRRPATPARPTPSTRSPGTRAASARPASPPAPTAPGVPARSAPTPTRRRGATG